MVGTQLRYGRFAAAQLVRDLRDRSGPDHAVAEIHSFVREVAYCLLSSDDIELGEFLEGAFMLWKLGSLDAYDKFNQEIMAMETFLEDNDRYVFQRRQ